MPTASHAPRVHLGGQGLGYLGDVRVGDGGFVFAVDATGPCEKLPAGFELGGHVGQGVRLDLHFVELLCTDLSALRHALLDAGAGDLVETVNGVDDYLHSIGFLSGLKSVLETVFESLRKVVRATAGAGACLSAAPGSRRPRGRLAYRIAECARVHVQWARVGDSEPASATGRGPLALHRADNRGAPQSRALTASGISSATRTMGIPVCTAACISAMARGRSSNL